MANDFLTTYTPLANDIAQQTGLDPSVVLGIIDTETGGGAHVKGNNIFGISPGGRVASYPDVQTASQAFVNLMQTPGYRGVAAAGDPASQAVALVRGGYNTANPNYASIVASKALNFGKQLGYQDQGGGSQSGPGVYSTSSQPAPDYNTPSPNAAQAPPQPQQAAAPDYNTVQKPPQQPQQPAAPATQPPQSEVDRALQSLPVSGGGQQPSGGSASPPKSEVDKALESLPSEKADTTQKQDQPSATASLTAPTDTTQGYFAPDGSYVPPSAMPSKDQAAQFDLDKVLPIFPKPAPGALGRVIEAGTEGWGGSPPILTPDARQAVDQSGVLGRYIYNPLLDIAGAGLGAGAAVFRGGQQLVNEAVSPIDPRLGRDIAALPEAFPTGGGEFHPLEPASTRVAQAEATRNPLQVGPSPLPPVTLEELTGAIRRADQAAAGNALAPTPSEVASGAAPFPYGPNPIGRPGVLGGMPDVTKGPFEGVTPTHIWRSADHDFPVTPTGTEGKAADGRVYAQVRQADGSLSYVPKDELHAAGTEPAQAQGAPERTGVPEPQAAGAQATPPEEIPAAEATGGKPSADRIRNIESAVNQSAEERAGPGMVDHTQYVENIPGRVQAEREFSTENSINHKYAYNDSEHPEYKAEVDRNARLRNEGMRENLRQDAGDQNTLDQAEKAREEQASPDAMGVFDNEKPIDTSDIAADIRKMLAGRQGKQKAVANTLNSVLERMYVNNDIKGGQLETSPSMNYGVRSHVRDLLNALPTTEEGQAARGPARAFLTQLLNKFDEKIPEGAPKYTDYMSKYGDMSQTINQQKFLQKALKTGGSVVNSDGYLQINGLNKLLAQIVDGLKSPKPNAAWSLTDGQIQNIINARNELAAGKLNERLGSVRGSPTFQLQSMRLKKERSVMGEIMRAGVRTGVSGLGAHLLHVEPMVANALMWGANVGGPAIREVRIQSAIKRAAAADAAKRNALLQTTPPPGAGQY